MLCFKTYRELLLLYCRPVSPLPTYVCTNKCKKCNEHGTISSVVPNIVTAVLLLYILWTGFYPPDLCLSMSKEFIVHGTISYVVFHKKLARIAALYK